MRLRLLLCIAMVSTACENRPAEFGVSVFADDTIPVSYALDVKGSLQIGIRAEGFDPGPNKSLFMTTPSQLIIQKGEGSATVTALKGGRVLIQPLGVLPDSGDTSSAMGKVVTFTRTGVQRAVKLKVEKP